MMSSPAARLATAIPPSIPGWTLLRAIGRGSYGEVWLAQAPDGVYRAVKLIYRSTFDNDRPYQRELSGIRRFEPISRGHQSQVAIFNVGESTVDGLFYYVMELADDAGQSSGSSRSALSQSPGADSIAATPSPVIDPATYQPKTLKSESSRRGRLPYRECLEIGVALATALDHLHQHGLIHRDIKPSNVIFVGGVPKLADIGLVTGLDASISFVGTEGFLPPEGPGTSQGDIYSLGKVLYEISTGQDRMDFPELPTLIGQGDEKEQMLELNQILLKACQNDIRQRYRTARELLDDLWLLQKGRSLRRIRATELRLRQARAGIIAIAIVAGLLMGGNHLLQQARIRKAELKAAREAAGRVGAETKAGELQRVSANLYSANGNKLWKDGDWFGALVLFERAMEIEAPESPRRTNHLQRVESILEQVPSLAFVIADTERFVSARYNDNGNQIITVNEAGVVQTWNANSGAKGVNLQSSGPVRSAALSPDGERALLVDRAGAVHLASIATPGLPTTLQPPGFTGPTAFSGSGRQIALVRNATNLVVMESSSRRERFTISHLQPITSISFGPDGQYIISGSAKGVVIINSSETGERAVNPILLEEPVEKVAVSANGRRLLTVTSRTVQLHDLRSGEPSPHALRHGGRVFDAVITPDGRTVVTGGEDGMARVWDAISGRLLASLPHATAVLRVAFSPDGRYLLTATDISAHLWHGTNFARHEPAFVHGGRLLTAGFSPDARHLLTLSDEGVVRVFALDRLMPATQTPAALPVLARLLSGRRLNDDEELATASRKEIAKDWRTFVAGQSIVELNEIEWHRATARLSESNQNWFAAAFHWDGVVQRQPLDAEARGQADAARGKLMREVEISARSGDILARIPARAADTDSRLLDLTRHFNVALTDSWLPTPAPSAVNDLGSLPQGVHSFNGIEFDVRGLIQLSSRTMENQGGIFPTESSGIEVNRSCRRLHFLHGAVWTSLGGTPIGNYVVHYEDGQTNQIKIVFGRDVREWWTFPTQQTLTTGAAVAWEGSNPAATAFGLRLRLFQIAWTNPRPAVRITHLDFRSLMEPSAPFLLAVTAEP